MRDSCKGIINLAYVRQLLKMLLYHMTNKNIKCSLNNNHKSIKKNSLRTN